MFWPAWRSSAPTSKPRPDPAADLGRTGETGILYNIHHPIDPERFRGTARDSIGVVKKIRDYSEY